MKKAHEEARQLLDHFDEIQKLWDEALAKSVENVAAAEILNGKRQSGKLDAVKNSLREDLENGKERKEDRESFLRRAVAEGYQVIEGKSAVYGYRSVRWESAGENARQVQKELTALGLNGDVFDGAILYNANGVTTELEVEQAVTVDKMMVLIKNNIDMSGKEVAGHEAFHLWSETPAGRGV